MKLIKLMYMYMNFGLNGKASDSTTVIVMGGAFKGNFARPLLCALSGGFCLKLSFVTACLDRSFHFPLILCDWSFLGGFLLFDAFCLRLRLVQ